MAETESAQKAKSSDSVTAWLKKGNNKFIAAGAVAVAAYAYYVKKKNASATTAAADTTTAGSATPSSGWSGFGGGTPQTNWGSQITALHNDIDYQAGSKERQLDKIDKEIAALQKTEAADAAAIKKLQEAPDKAKAAKTGDGSVSTAVPGEVSSESDGLESIPASTSGGKTELDSDGTAKVTTESKKPETKAPEKAAVPARKPTPKRAAAKKK